MTLPRGFKASAEREAVQLRRELGLSPADRLNIQELAANLDVKVVDAGTLIDVGRLEEIERIQAFAFSAATFAVNDKNYVVTNPVRTDPRRNSDIAHELSHLILKHELTEIREVDGVPFRTCQPQEEEQATAFGGTLMLPRPLLLAAASKGMGPQQIANTYEVTLEMARFRYNSTGVEKQVRRFSTSRS
ncbi:ImmA/IrrE family metallo-endopeptidase [Actinomadura darangshiensis]|uniref:ImmA/IrrE family metallo-endopeptidase n=1 Tax=Actinomadura darangshiensis TaxID=705336 RepID=A0A4R5BQ50_9ACTN|nr:ImmA/IrrE family metallo-endopeptidase [Actinomadura darangshiensis]TDD87340.1 ImmA/IrrE family metallo-endopeptidase [Actinomadura darangshiensis]